MVTKQNKKADSAAGADSTLQQPEEPAPPLPQRSKLGDTMLPNEDSVVSRLFHARQG